MSLARVCRFSPPKIRDTSQVASRAKQVRDPWLDTMRAGKIYRLDCANFIAFGTTVQLPGSWLIGTDVFVFSHETDREAPVPLPVPVPMPVPQ